MLPTFTQGMGITDFSARGMNELVDVASRGGNLTVGDGLQMIKTRRSIDIQLAPAVPLPLRSAVNIDMYVIDDIAADHYTGRLFDGNSPTDVTVSIAKPFELRRTPFDGKSWTYDFPGGDLTVSYTYTFGSGISRTVTLSDESTIKETIVPPYKRWNTETKGTVIWAVDQVETGVGIPNNPEDPTSFTEVVSLLDLNVGGRAWAELAGDV